MAFDRSDMTSGAAREFMRSARIRTILFVVLLLSVYGIGSIQAVKTCEGFNGIRAGLNVSADAALAASSRALARSHVDTGRSRMLDLAAYHSDLTTSRLRFRKLDCSLPFPDTH